MPLYEYQCQQCGHRLEALQKFSDDPLTTCEVCGGTLKKLISAPAVQFKGTGWYVTDYAGKSGDSGKSSDSGGKSESKSDGGGDGKNSKKESGDSASSSSGGSKEKASTSSSSD